jgi:hypothetical protein
MNCAVCKYDDTPPSDGDLRRVKNQADVWGVWTQITCPDYGPFLPVCIQERIDRDTCRQIPTGLLRCPRCGTVRHPETIPQDANYLEKAIADMEEREASKKLAESLVADGRGLAAMFEARDSMKPAPLPEGAHDMVHRLDSASGPGEAINVDEMERNFRKRLVDTIDKENPGLSSRWNIDVIVDSILPIVRQ